MTPPPAYIVKEIQRVIAFVIANHIHMSNTSMKKTEILDRFFLLYHGNPEGNEETLSFLKQAVQSLGVFSCLFAKEDAPVIARLTNSPDRPVCFKINPLLLPGTDQAVYVGVGPSADIRLEHLELGSPTSQTKTLIAGRTLYLMGDTVKALLRRVEPIAKECLNSDGEFPSGTNLADYLKKLAEKIVEYDSKGQFVNDIKSESVVASLTQGACAKAKAKADDAVSKWKKKWVPLPGWFAIALFCMNGIAKKDLEDRLPLLKLKDYDKKEKKNHSRAVARREAVEAKRRPASNSSPAVPNEHFMASMVMLMADNNETANDMDEFYQKKDQLRMLQKEMERVEFRIRHYSKLGCNVDHLLAQHERMLMDAEAMRSTVNKIMELKSNSQKRKEENIEHARKLAKLVHSQPLPGIVPSLVGAGHTSIVSELKTQADNNNGLVDIDACSYHTPQRVVEQAQEVALPESQNKDAFAISPEDDDDEANLE